MCERNSVCNQIAFIQSDAKDSKWGVVNRNDLENSVEITFRSMDKKVYILLTVEFDASNVQTLKCEAYRTDEGVVYEDLQTPINAVLATEQPCLSEILEIIKENFVNMKCSKTDDAKQCNAKNKASSRKKKKPNDSSVAKNSKKPPMKTARDVINRILWDNDFRSELFIVGYLDRMLGIVEKPFDKFDWEMKLEEIDYVSSFGIPEHRIQYIKFLDKKVWDKIDRLDLIFGSTGDEILIHDLIAHSEQQALVPLRLQNDMEIATRNQPEHESDPIHNDALPNYFLSCRVDNSEFKWDYEDDLNTYIQFTQNGKLNSVSAQSLHITLLTLRIDHVYQNDSAIQMMMDAIDFDYVTTPFPLTLSFKKLEVYHSRILALEFDDECNDLLQELNKQLLHLCHEYGIPLCGNREQFVPHITLLKYPSESKHTINMDDCVVFSTLLNHKLEVNGVHLCALKEKDPNGFFRIISSFGVK